MRGTCTTHTAIAQSQSLFFLLQALPGVTFALSVQSLVRTTLLNCRAHTAGIQVLMHVITDGAARMASTAVERAQRRDPRQHRHRLEHGADVESALEMRRLRELGLRLVATPSEGRPGRRTSALPDACRGRSRAHRYHRHDGDRPRIVRPAAQDRLRREHGGRGRWRSARGGAHLRGRPSYVHDLGRARRFRRDG